jgi:hypothetical protein
MGIDAWVDSRSRCAGQGFCAAIGMRGATGRRGKFTSPNTVSCPIGMRGMALTRKLNALG